MKFDSKLYDTLAQYIRLLAQGLQATNRAEERALYMQHLSNAAVLFQAACDGDMVALHNSLEQARRTYGTTFLSGKHGDEAEKAFHHFAHRAAELDCCR